MANARLTVEISASEAKFREDLGKAVKHADTAAKQIGVAFSGLKGIISGALAGLSIGAFVNIVKGSIDAADKLNDLSQSTGVAVETLGGLGFAAKQSGTDLEGVAKGFGKFNLEIAKAAGGNEQAIATFGKVGVSIKDLNTLKPEEIFGKVADAFNKFADGPNKAALGSELFKKSYQDLIPLLNEGGAAILQNVEYFQKYSGVSAELTQRASDFNDAVEKAKLLNGAFGNALASALLPSLQSLIGLYVEAKEKGDGFAGTADRIADGLKIIAKAATVAVLGFINLGDAIGALMAKGVALIEGRFKDAFVNIDKDREVRIKELQDQYRKISDAIDGKGAASGLTLSKKSKPPAPSLGSPDREDTAKKFLDQQLKGLENSIKEEQDLLSRREQFLKEYYQEDQIGIKDYFDRRQTVIDDAVQKQIALYDKELKALEDFKVNAKQKDRIETDTKIAEVIAKRAKLEQDSAEKAITLWFDQRKAAREFQSQVEDITIAIANMSGDTIGAGLAGFDKTFAQFQQRAQLRADSTDPNESNAGRQALSRLESLRGLTEQQLRLNKTQNDFRGIIEDVGIATTRINLQQKAGAITELDAINQRSAVARENIGRLQAEAEAYRALAESLPKGEAQTEALRNVQRLTVEIEQLTLAADELKLKFDEIFIGAVADGLTELITGTKSVKEAFKDMEKQIVASISRIASQNIAESIFGKGGPGGGVGGLFASLFGGGSGAAGGGLADFFKTLLPGFATGTSSAPGGLALVGERGPEIVNLPRGSQVIPNRSINSGPNLTVVNHVTVMPGASRETADQAAMRVGMATQRAMARNG